MPEVLPWQNSSGIIVPRFPNGMGIPNSRERVGTKSIWETVAVFSCVGQKLQIIKLFHVYSCVQKKIGIHNTNGIRNKMLV